MLCAVVEAGVPTVIAQPRRRGLRQRHHDPKTLDPPFFWGEPDVGAQCNPGAPTTVLPAVDR